jgi:hypothetical protein
MLWLCGTCRRIHPKNNSVTTHSGALQSNKAYQAKPFASNQYDRGMIKVYLYQAL